MGKINSTRRARIKEVQTDKSIKSKEEDRQELTRNLDAGEYSRGLDLEQSHGTTTTNRDRGDWGFIKGHTIKG